MSAAICAEINTARVDSPYREEMLSTFFIECQYIRKSQRSIAN